MLQGRLKPHCELHHEVGHRGKLGFDLQTLSLVNILFWLRLLPGEADWANIFLAHRFRGPRHRFLFVYPRASRPLRRKGRRERARRIGRLYPDVVGSWR